jgi:WD40 repeat protein
MNLAIISFSICKNFISHLTNLNLIYQTWDKVHVLSDHTDCVSFLSWSPDDTKILTCGQDNVLKLWNVEVKKFLPDN